MTNYDSGARRENEVRAALELDGYRCIRSAGSKGPVDLVALKPGQVLLVQVKRVNGLLPPVERRALLEVARYCRALPIVAYRPVRGVLAYRLLTGEGPNDFLPWTADVAA